MVWYGMVYVNLYSAIVANFSNALGTLVPGKQPSFQALSEGAKVLLCAEVVRQRVPNSRAVHSECSVANSGEPVSRDTHVCQAIIIIFSVDSQRYRYVSSSKSRIHLFNSMHGARPDNPHGGSFTVVTGFIRQPYVVETALSFTAVLF